MYWTPLHVPPENVPAQSMLGAAILNADVSKTEKKQWTAGKKREIITILVFNKPLQAHI